MLTDEGVGLLLIFTIGDRHQSRSAPARPLIQPLEARELVHARGGGTSQSSQTVNATLIVDCSKYLDRVLERALRADLG